jgi:hypothetical protein
VKQAFKNIIPEGIELIKQLFRKLEFKGSVPAAIVARGLTWLSGPKERLFKAAQTGSEKEIRAAILAGADVNAAGECGVTPLILSASRGSADNVKALLSLGADASMATDEGYIALDFARGAGNLEVENALLGRGSEFGSAGTVSDLDYFLDQAELKLPQKSWEWFQAHLLSELGEIRAAQVEDELKAGEYRILFEQLFGSEALACAHFSAKSSIVMRSPMALGAFDVEQAKRRKIDLVDQFKLKFEITDRFLRDILPDDIFWSPPRTVCEIGGAWGATIKHLTERFSIEEYHNYEPDRHYARFVAERFGAKKMPVDGETLQGTETDSMDLVLANNVLIFVPPMKIWSYLTEMRRVVKIGGLVLFNAIISDQLEEKDLRHYLDTCFPRRTFQLMPRDIIDRTFPTSHFELLKTVDREYLVFRRIA